MNVKVFRRFGHISVREDCQYSNRSVLDSESTRGQAVRAAVPLLSEGGKEAQGKGAAYLAAICDLAQPLPEKETL